MTSNNPKTNEPEAEGNPLIRVLNYESALRDILWFIMKRLHPDLPWRDFAEMARLYGKLDTTYSVSELKDRVNKLLDQWESERYGKS